MMEKQFKLSLTLKTSLILFAMIGVIFAESLRSLFYFTLQSALFMMMVQIVFLVDEIRKKQGKTSFINKQLRMLKFVALVAVMVTFFVFGVILLPTLALEDAIGITSVTLHFIVPLLALADFLLFDFHLVIRKRDVLYALIPSLYYLVFVMIFVLLGIKFPPGQQLVPYFFLDFETYGWLTISNQGIGVIYWIAIILLIITLIGFALRYLIIRVKRAS